MSESTLCRYALVDRPHAAPPNRDLRGLRCADGALTSTSSVRMCVRLSSASSSSDSPLLLVDLSLFASPTSIEATAPLLDSKMLDAYELRLPLSVGTGALRLLGTGDVCERTSDGRGAGDGVEPARLRGRGLSSVSLTGVRPFAKSIYDAAVDRC